MHRIQVVVAGKERKRERERCGRGPPKDPPRTKWSPLILRCYCKVHPSPESPLLLSHRFFLILSLLCSSFSFLLFLQCSLLFLSLFLFLSLSLSPSTGPGIPSCGCKIDGASRDNCCSGTRFQTRVHLEYSWRKALPIVNGRGRTEGGKEGA